jgi:hypothetical protein
MPSVGVLVCAGVFEVVLPDGWRASGQPGRTYDIAPSEGDVGLNISVYDSQGLPTQDTETLVRRFAESVGLADAAAARVVTPEHGASQRRSFLSFAHDGRAWFAGFLIFPGGALLATSNSAEGDEASRAIGEQIIASISPLKDTKRRFGRPR